jgi:hypothetical protein
MEIDPKRHFKIYNKFADVLEEKIVFAFSGIESLDEVQKYKEKFN